MCVNKIQFIATLALLDICFFQQKYDFTIIFFLDISFISGQMRISILQIHLITFSNSETFEWDFFYNKKNSNWRFFTWKNKFQGIINNNPTVLVNSDVIRTLNKNYLRKQKQLFRGIKTLCRQNPGDFSRTWDVAESFCKQQNHDAWCKNADLLQMKFWSVSVFSSVLYVTLISHAPLLGRHMIFCQIGDISVHRYFYMALDAIIFCFYFI